MRDLTINKFIFITEGFIKNQAFYLLNRFTLSFGWILKIKDLQDFEDTFSSSSLILRINSQGRMHLVIYLDPDLLILNAKVGAGGWGAVNPPSLDWHQNKKAFKYILPTIFHLFGINNDHW